MPVDSARPNSVAFGPSVGSSLGKNSVFWGYGLDYARHLTGRWSLSVGLAYDEETEKRGGQPDKVTQTYTLTTAASRSLSDRLGLAFGIGHGLLDDDNPRRDLESSDAFGTGVVLSWTALQRNRHSLAISSSLEYSFTDKDYSVSIDATYAFGF